MPENRRRPSWWSRTGSTLVRGHLLHNPVERGKWAMATFAARRFLVARLPDDVWVRINDWGNFHQKQILLRDDHEPRTTALFRDLLAPGQVVFDVGANLGYYALTAAARVAPGGAVHAFEPTPDIAEHLRANVALNGFDNVTVNAVAVGAEAGTVALRTSREYGECNTIIGGEHPNADEGGAGEVEVPLVRLDDYAAEQGVERVDVLKIDVEGAETLVLDGAEPLLAGADAPVILLEVNPGALARAGTGAGGIHQRLTALGYRSHLVEALGDSHANLLAVKPDLEARWPALARWGLPLATGAWIGETP